MSRTFLYSWLTFLLCLSVEAGNAATEQVIALTAERIYTSAADEPLRNAVVVVAKGKIAAVGDKSAVRIPPHALTVDCKGMSVTAGFWNSHVHFIEHKWQDADRLPASRLTAQLQAMLTRYGFVYVFETATFNLEHTLALRNRIHHGEVKGPRIYTTGAPFAPLHGSPAYIAPRKLAELSTAAEADRFVRAQIASGADGVKFFAASPSSWTTVETMPLDVAKAAVAAAHELNKTAFAHPTTIAGVRIAAESGVDVLAHTSPDNMESWDTHLIQQLMGSKVALIPTLKLYQWDPARQGVPAPMVKRIVDTAVQQLHDYAIAGGEVLFGTDVGYMTDYDPQAEYMLMQQAGLNFRQILVSLTTAPAAKFGASSRTGTISIGMNADLVVIGGNPETNLRALTDVRYVYREGQLLYPAQ